VLHVPTPHGCDPPGVYGDRGWKPLPRLRGSGLWSRFVAAGYDQDCQLLVLVAVWSGPFLDWYETGKIQARGRALRRSGEPGPHFHDRTAPASTGIHGHKGHR